VSNWSLSTIDSGFLQKWKHVAFHH
jgi:hypothetical protein